MVKFGIHSFQFTRGGCGSVAVISFLLGGVAAGSLLVTAPFFASVLSTVAGKDFYAFLLFVALFHFGEYILTAMYNPQTCTTDSFLLNHSPEFNIAYAASVLEYFIEQFFFPSMKTYRLPKIVGFLVVVAGDIFRKIAMYKAGSNFTHQVQERKRESHELVQSGIYSISRHPSYFGWFYWAVGTQVLLSNPLCILGYAIAAWRFFKERIEEEEGFLIQFFGEAYIDYKKKVPTRIPFIN